MDSDFSTRSSHSAGSDFSDNMDIDSILSNSDSILSNSSSDSDSADFYDDDSYSSAIFSDSESDSDSDSESDSDSDSDSYFSAVESDDDDFWWMESDDDDDDDDSMNAGFYYESDNDHDDDAMLVLNPDDLLYQGLKFVGFNEKQINKANKTSRVRKFTRQFGASHIVYAHIWNDLQTTDVENALVPPQKLNLNYFLMALYFLRKYPTEEDRECKFNFSHGTIATWTWYYLERIQALKAAKIVWDYATGDDIWVITVDGTHCWINEPKHPTLSINSAYYSHKYNKAGIDYEFGISLSKNRLVWMNGPHPAGDSDLTVFTLTDGLRDKLRQTGKRGIADRGYVGYDELSIPNAHDEENVRLFKSRALKRHENFNGMTKVFKALDGRFRHSLDRFSTCFESICVICQYQIELGNPLADILTPSMV